MSQHNDPSRGWLWPWILLAAFVGVWVTGIYLLVDRSQVTQPEAVQALAFSSFEGHLPAGVELKTSGSDKDESGPVVVFGDNRDTPHAKGGAVQLVYRFRPSQAEATREFEDMMADLPEILDRTLRPRSDRKMFELLDPAPIPIPSLCLHHWIGLETCEFVVRDVRVEVRSSLPLFVPGEESHIHELSRAAYEHIARLLHL